MRGRRILLLLLATLAAGPAAAAAGATLVPVGTFARPTFITAPPGDVHRAFVVERAGAIRVVKDGVKLPAPFLDISAQVATDDDQSTERGLLSMAFAPDYDQTGRFYVYYTGRPPASPQLGDIVVDEYRRSATNPDVADPSTRRTILAIPHSAFDYHNGGQLAFGPDGLLWIGVGDGGGDSDPAGNGQNPGTLLGKILRVDPRPGDALAPADNPFAAGGGSPLVWSYGLRNPFRFSFDRLTGDLAIGDVGESFDEEVDFAPKAAGLGRGANYGWNIIEGNYAYNKADRINLKPATPAQLPAGYAGPVIDHLHSSGWCSIIGGYVLRDAALPDLSGRYIYGDFCNGVLYSATLTPSGAVGDGPIPGLAKVNLISSFGEDGCGRLYVASIDGPVSRLATSGVCAGPAPVPFSTPPPTAAPVAAPGPAGGAGARAGVGAGAGAGRAAGPGLQVRAPTRQAALRRGYVALAVRCRARCALTVSGTLRAARARGARRRPAQVAPLAGVRRTLRGGARATLRLRLPTRSRRLAASALAARRVVTVHLVVVATSGGRRATSRLAVRLTR